MKLQIQRKVNKPKITHFRMKNRKLAVAKLKSLITYDPDIAKRFHDIRYYENIEDENRNLDRKEKEKKRLGTPRHTYVTDLIEKAKHKAE
jgi:hypothetical protein